METAAEEKILQLGLSSPRRKRDSKKKQRVVIAGAADVTACDMEKPTCHKYLCEGKILTLEDSKHDKLRIWIYILEINSLYELCKFLRWKYSTY